MLCIFSVPASAARTCRRKTTPMSSAMAAITATVTTSVRLVPASSMSLVAALMGALACAKPDIPSSLTGIAESPLGARDRSAPRAWTRPKLPPRVPDSRHYPAFGRMQAVTPPLRGGLRGRCPRLHQGLVDSEYLVETGDLED